MNTIRQMRDMVVADYLQLRAPIMVLDLDEQYIIRKANQYAGTLLGADCIGTSISLLVIDFNKQFDPEKLSTMPTGSLISFKNPSGTPVSLKVSFLPVGDAGILIGEHDLQEAEELQTTLLNLNGELSTISRELQKKTIQLQQANKLKDQLMGIAAHDLRSPLAGVYSYIELLLDELHGSPISQPLEEILREVGYMLNLVTNLLDHSVIEQGQIDLSMTPCNVTELLQQAIQLHSLLANKRKIKVLLQVEQAPEVILLDQNRIRQVLNNLLGNAVKYTPDGGVVQTICSITAGRQLLVQLLDQGPGVPDGEIGKLFSPFGRTSAKSFSGEKSTGLGLSICKRIVETHGGKIWEENRSEGGACFSFTLPLTSPEDQEGGHT